MAIHASLAAPSGPALEVDAAPCYRIAGRRLERGPGHDLLTEDLHAGWSFHGERRPFCLACHAITVRFQSEAGDLSAPLGPYDLLFVATHYAYGDDQLVACFCPHTNTWLAERDGAHWPIMILEEVRVC